MHASTDYNIKLNANSAEQEDIYDVLKSRIHDVTFSSASEIVIKETFDCVFEEDIIELAKAMAQGAPSASFEISGRIDTSFSAGELMDFTVAYSNRELTFKFSDWYVDVWMADFSDYEDFCDKLGAFPREAYNKIKDCKAAYILETDDGDILSDHVPFVREETFRL